MYMSDEQRKKASQALRESLRKKVSAGPKSDGLFDRMSHSFSKDLLTNIDNVKVIKSHVRKTSSR